MQSSAVTVVRDERRRITYALRPYAGPQDDGAIFHPWCHSIRKLGRFGRMDPAAFRAYKQRVLEPLVARCGVIFACAEATPWRVYAWICGERTEQDEPVLHFIYTQKTFRGHGIATTLLRCALQVIPGRDAISHTHPTIAMRAGLAAKWRSTYRPDLVRK